MIWLALGAAVALGVPAASYLAQDRIVLAGRRLGTGVAAHVAARREVRGVILISPYDSMVSLARHHYPFLPVSWLLRHRFDSIALAPGIRAPLLAIAAAHDGVVPPAHSRRLHDAWGAPKTWVLIADADHNALGREEPFWQPIRAFLEAARVARRRGGRARPAQNGGASRPRSPKLSG